MTTHHQAVALVTGAGSGIGRATAKLLCQNGHSVVLVGRRAAALEETAAEIGAAASAVVSADIADPAEARRCVQAAVDRFGRIDVLINNAGAAPLAGITQSTPEMLAETFAINALAPANLIAAAWPIMTAARRGCIINVSTLGTHDPFPGFFAYAAAKGAVNVMARSCAKEGKAVGIRAFAVAPGAVETDMLRKNFSEARVPKNACLTPDAVATVILDCVLGKYDARNGDTLFVTAQSGVR